MLYSRAISTTAVLAAAVLPSVFAQTSTECNPLQKTCPSNPGLSSSTFNTDFSQGHSGWTATNPGVTYGSNGAAFTISGDGQAPTLQTDTYILFGRVDVTMQASPGVGIVSSIVLLSETLDEIDWEFLGGVPGQVQTNFFGKGDTSSYDRVTYVPTANNQAAYHTYSIDWTAERIQWLIDGAVVRTLSYGDALAAGGKLYPQTPARVKLGNWVAGGANNAPGTVQWAGGKTDFSQAPFVMNIKSVSITNYSPADTYTYSDNSGSYQSIKLSGGSSPQKAPVEPSSASAAPASSQSSAATPPPPASTTITSSAQASTTIVSTSSITRATASTTSAVIVTISSTTTSPQAVGTGSGTRAPSSISTSITSSASSSTPAATYTGSASSLQAGAAGSLLGLVAAAAALAL